MKNKQNIIIAYKLWLAVFASLNVIFAFYYITFFWGNHDWDWIKGTTQVLQFNTGMFEGRYAKFILNVGLFGGQVLPIFNNLVAFALLSFGAVLLTSYWNITNFSNRLLVALVFTTAPYILGWLYFPINILGNFAAVALVAYGLKLTEKNKFFSVLCFILALGVYPSVAEMMIVCLCVHYIMKSTTIKAEILKSSAVVLCSLICFQLLLLILGKLGIIYSEHYNMQTLPITELLNRIPQTIILAFTQLVTTLPFLQSDYKIIAVLLLVLAIISTYKRWIWWGIALGATVLSSFLTAIPEETAYAPRINFYGVNFLIAGAVAVLLAKKSVQRNLGLFLCIVLVWNGIKADIEATKVWSLGRISETALVERISSQIEQKASQDLHVPIIAGELPLRPRYYVSSYQKKSPYILNGALLVRHIPSGMFNFYAKSPLFYNYSQIDEISPELYNFIKTTWKPWPKDNSLFIDEKYVVILLTDEGASAIKAQLPY